VGNANALEVRKKPTGGPWATPLHVLTDLEAAASLSAEATVVNFPTAVLAVESMVGVVRS